MLYLPNQRLQGLYLNSIFGRMEDMTLIAVSYSEEELIAYLNSQRADSSYTKDFGDRTFQMSFKEGSPLETFNYPFMMDEAIRFWKTEEDAMQEYREFLLHIISTKSIPE